MHPASFGAIQQQPVEHFARVNHDGLAHLETRAMAAAGNQFRGANDFLGLRRVQQERISFDGLMGQAAAAGFFPGEPLVVNRDSKARARQPLSAERTGGTSADDGYVFHDRRLDAVVPGSGEWKDDCNEPSREYSTKNAAAVVAEPVRTRNDR